VKLFQIEEPDGSPTDSDAPGAAIGVDLGGLAAEVAMSVGGNAATLEDRDGFALDLSLPRAGAGLREWTELFEGVRLRAERALARPVTHAVVALADAALAETVARAAAAAGIEVLRVIGRGESPAAEAAMLAEDLAPRPEVR
jgi:hypothetical protein